MLSNKMRKPAKVHAGKRAKKELKMFRYSIF